MAVNEKAVYAVAYTTHAGVLFAPGERIDGRMAAHAVQGAQEQGLTGDHAAAERARGAEEYRRQQVAEQQTSRSEAREPEQRIDRR